MNFKDFMKALDGKPKQVYLLSGKETFYIDKALEKILSKLKISRQDIFTIEFNKKMPINEIVNALESSSLFASQNVVLVKNAIFFGNEGKTDNLEKILKDMPPSNYAIFITETVDKRRKLYKIALQVGDILEAEPLRAWQINEWLDEKLKSIKKVMTPAARKFFDERVEMLPEISLWFLENELNKVADYVSGKEISDKDLQKILTEPPELSNFAIIDAVNAKQTEKALSILKNQLSDVSKIPLIIGLLVRNVRQLLLAKTLIKRGLKPKDLTRPLEVSSVYIAQKLSATAQSYSTKLLEEIFIELADADFNFKIGRAGAEVLEKIIVKLSRR